MWECWCVYDVLFYYYYYFLYSYFSYSSQKTIWTLFCALAFGWTRKKIYNWNVWLFDCGLRFRDSRTINQKMCCCLLLIWITFRLKNIEKYKLLLRFFLFLSLFCSRNVFNVFSSLSFFVVGFYLLHRTFFSAGYPKPPKNGNMHNEFVLSVGLLSIIAATTAAYNVRENLTRTDDWANYFPLCAHEEKAKPPRIRQASYRKRHEPKRMGNT